MEMDLPSDDGMWSVIAYGSEVDAIRSRHATMRCFAMLTGYEPTSLSAAEVGVECVSLVPDLSSAARNVEFIGDDTLFPFVSSGMCQCAMVFCGILRSLVRLRNELKTVLGIFVACLLPKSSSICSNMRSAAELSAHNRRGSVEKSLESPHPVVVLEAGSSNYIPIQ